MWIHPDPPHTDPTGVWAEEAVESVGRTAVCGVTQRRPDDRAEQASPQELARRAEQQALDQALQWMPCSHRSPPHHTEHHTN
jgi:hypothetical protein